jgi:AcrR family transcriptional regulator
LTFSPPREINGSMGKTRADIRIPQQQRSRETKARMLRSAEYLFSKKGFYKTNSKEIARRAGVAVGNFYAYFRDKKDILLELLEEHNQNVLDSILLFQGAADLHRNDPKTFLISMIENAIAAHDHLPEYHRDITFLIYSDPEVKAAMKRYKRVALGKVKDLLAQLRERLRITDLDAAAILLMRITEDAVHGIKYDREPIAKKRLISELADMMCRYLFKES